MKKFFSTLLLTCSTILLAAQISIISEVNIPEDGDKWGMSNFTNELGIGYEINDNILIGIKKDSIDYLMIGRYITPCQIVYPLFPLSIL